MDVVNRLDRLGLTDETFTGDFFIGSTLESYVAEEAAALVLLLSSESGSLNELSFLDMQKRMKDLRDRGVKIDLNNLVKGVQELVEGGFLTLREEGFKPLITPSPLLLDAVEIPEHHF